MHNEDFDNLAQQLEAAIASGEDPDDAADRIFPRLFYMGHKVTHTFQHPDKRAKWECYSCKHQWVSKVGDWCPECKDCKHVWKLVAEPYGEQDRACEFCGITLRESIGDEQLAAYIKQEQEGRK